MSNANLDWFSRAAVAIALTYVLGPTLAAELEDKKFEAAAVVQLAAEPPARLLVDAPLPEQLALGRVVLRYRAENLKILPVYGAAALEVSPRIGHMHITVDDGPWRWVDASGQPVIINKLSPGKHKVLLELVDPTHKLITGQTVNFEVPTVPTAPAH
jgi:hypothetical protein